MTKQTILITGCSHGGIGYATAKYLHELGHIVFASVRRQAELDQLTAEGINTYLLDVCDYKQFDNVLEQVLEKTGGTLDVLFNNAGYGQAGALEDIETKYLIEQFNTNVFGLHHATRQVMKVMRKQGYGKIIQHSSVLGLVTMRYRGAYCASKYAIEGITDVMRQELAGSNIFMSSLNTGPVTSKFRENCLKTIDNIDSENSPHLKEYYKIVAGTHQKIPFNEEAISVAKVVERIMNSKKPKPRYYITKATWIMAILKRVLPTAMLDKVLAKS